MTSTIDPALAVKDLSVTYFSRAGIVPSLRRVTVNVMPGKIVGVVGESGCGKSTLAASITGLLAANGKITSGSVVFDGTNLTDLAERDRRKLRGSDIAMVFQDPLTSLNPTLRIGSQMADALRAHHGSGWTRSKLRKEVCQALDQVGIPDPDRHFDSYPHELSGGMRQRVLIGACVLLRPTLLVADEPTSALDVTLGAQILELLTGLRNDHGTAILLISHDLGVIAETADEVIVLYAGEVVEAGETKSVFGEPRHPYTRALLDAFPRLGQSGTQLVAIPGVVPQISSLPPGCVFAPRCRHAEPVCDQRHPELIGLESRLGRCHMLDPDSGHSAAHPRTLRPG